MVLSIIVAAAENNVIGRDNGLIWRLSADLKRFKALTTGHTILMGRKTFESIGRALPNRRNIVISRNPEFEAAGCEVVHSVEEALELTKNEDEVFVTGEEQFTRSCGIKQIGCILLSFIKNAREIP